MSQYTPYRRACQKQKFVFAAWQRVWGMVFSLQTLFSTLFTILICSALQQQTPLHLVNKVIASLIALASCASPLGQAMYGILFDIGAGVPCLILLGATGVALCILVYSKRVFWRLEVEKPLASDTAA